jgi:hypothetical protein
MGRGEVEIDRPSLDLDWQPALLLHLIFAEPGVLLVNLFFNYCNQHQHNHNSDRHTSQRCSGPVTQAFSPTKRLNLRRRYTHQEPFL